MVPTFRGSLMHPDVGLPGSLRLLAVDPLETAPTVVALNLCIWYVDVCGYGVDLTDSYC